MTGRWFWSAYPGPRIRFRSAHDFAPWVHRYLAFKGPLLRRWERDGLFPVQPQPAPGGRDYGSDFDDLLRLAHQSDRRAQLRAVNRLEALLLDLSHTPPPDAPNLPGLDKALAQIMSWAESSHEEPDYDQLAERLNISPSTLRRRIVAATGTSPHGYLLQCRSAHARALLGGTDLPIKTIAKRLGYRDVYFFSRQFRQQVGTPPAVYRKSRQRSET